uniref:Amidohydrolase-related domain-containing protein n=1 Tax=Chromera velia CCMP2878 TaxID=1169474 RepID=A0A0K6S627_9ALVE|eukprot:Cvel_14235.t1-p1 / transcript=Cvel_14235.t1 / gene=Cvel_14235 / organism=Chromera_velia_CCMP2878 / gene_product=Probable allantoinase 2, putative / transcript_product=Probable allantoinase 2, putative / location=Cvel_scaffold1004:33305-33955(+) / protein_length=217 / sequence_SO=supercontig / SO=protein_coding / is_pseudo=false
MMQNAWRGALIYLCGLVSASDEVRRLLSRRVLLPSGLTTACVIVSPRTNQISQIIEGLDASSDCCIDECDDWGDLVILPGGIDPHVHVSEPGQTFEGFASASVAALVGGTTTFLDMPLNSVPASTSMPALVEKWKAMAAAFNGDGDGGGDGDNQALLAVDVGLIGGAVPGNSAHLPKLATDGGVLAFKSFMLPSQSEDFPGSDLPDLKAVSVKVMFS